MNQFSGVIMARSPYLAYKFRNHAVSGVHLSGAGRLFLLLTILLSLVGGSHIGVQAAADTAHVAAAPAGAITYIGDIGATTSKTSGTSLVVNTTAPVTAGDAIIIAYATDPNANVSFSLTDSVGNTYTQVGYAVNTGQLRTYIFAAYNVNALPSGSTITINAGVAVTARAAVASVFRGLADEDVLDRTSTGTGNSASPSSGATATTVEADELLIGAIGTGGPRRRRRRDVGRFVHRRPAPGHDRGQRRYQYHRFDGLPDRLNDWRVHCRQKWHYDPRLGRDDRHLQGRARSKCPSDHDHWHAVERLQQCARDAIGGTKLHGVRQQPDR